MATQTPIDINSLMPEQRKQLFEQLEQEQLHLAQKKAENIATYKSMVDDTVTACYQKLSVVSTTLAEVKKQVETDFAVLLQMKSDLYGINEEQTSHSFTTKDGTITIILGHNIIDSYDDTVNTGIAKVNDYIRSLGKDKESKALVDAVMKLLSKDGKGNLKASRVLQLKQMAEKSENKDFIEGVNIIQDAYRPIKSKKYIRCMFTDNSGAKLMLPLSITDVGGVEDSITTDVPEQNKE